MSDNVRIAVIGGSGLYNMPGLTDVSERRIDTPFGEPSDAVVIGTLEGVRVAFLARHGRGHRIMPTEVNYRANIYALKTLGVERIVSVSACGSLREHLRPADVVVPDQLFDYTRDRARSFFGRGLVAHVSVAEPFCGELSEHLLTATRAASDKSQVHRGGRLITIEGPRFSTRCESNTYRMWGMDVIGMTACPEAFLAREAEMCYAVMCHITDYDVWHDTAEPVTVEMVVRRLHQNTALAQQSVARLAAMLAAVPRTCHCGEAMAGALITDRTKIPERTLSELQPLIGRYLQ